MSDQEIATFFLHWICHAKETRLSTEFHEVIKVIKINPRFAKLPVLYQGQIEGFYMGLLAVQENLVG